MSEIASRLFTQSFIQTQIKENIKAPRHWPLCGEFTGDRWIPRTNGQLCGKCFHLMTSSWSLWLVRLLGVIILPAIIWRNDNAIIRSNDKSINTRCVRKNAWSALHNQSLLRHSNHCSQRDSFTVTLYSHDDRRLASRKGCAHGAKEFGIPMGLFSSQFLGIHMDPNVWLGRHTPSRFWRKNPSLCPHPTHTPNKGPAVPSEKKPVVITTNHISPQCLHITLDALFLYS